MSILKIIDKYIIYIRDLAVIIILSLTLLVTLQNNDVLTELKDPQCQGEKH